MHDDTLFARIAVEEGFLSQDQVDSARRDSAGAGLADALQRRGALNESQIRTIRDIQRIHLAEVNAPAETGGMIRQDRLLLPCAACDTYYLIQGQSEGTKFACRKCGRVLVVRRGLETPPRPAREGSRSIGPYDLFEEIGRGSMSVVHRAVRRDTGAVVALKVLKESEAPHARAVRRFEQEALAVRRLNHPGIVPVLDSGEYDGVFVIAMKPVDGTTLDRALASRSLRLREFVEVLEQVALAAHHAHEQGVVHRDLKPANIILDADHRPHVTDFGLAKLEQDKSATHTGASLGTPFYMSPEQVSGDVAGTDARSDLYAMGVVLYEALTGRVPFPGSSVMDVYRGVLGGRPPRPSELNPKVPPELEAVCLKAISRDKEQRHPSALALAGDLRRWLDSNR